MINPKTQDLGNLAGRNERKFAFSNWGPQWSPTAKPVEWLVKATGPDARVTAIAVSEKGGTVRVSEALVDALKAQMKKGRCEPALLFGL
ncbi:hypothetical protein [Devosia psychrophila]|uniref:Uncharacterized protein n=1 Tax=Devosia psychrophila TaxID=728005 RepID=A0A0F5PYN4_9HYPH|nr:hypothetical protein [Devosia psychrophila]KKC33516.1 hypothetical protein WH91_08300 [Devosia psychrophila]SFD15832.1 hypothetical protein SAMN04488059_12450 [Devosia psychrophila]